MSQATHQIFKRIAVHNKLLTEPEADALLAEFDDPEHAVQQLVERHKLNAKSAEQFLGLYKKQVDKLFAEELEAFDEPAAKPAASPQPAAPASKPAAPAPEPAPRRPPRLPRSPSRWSTSSRRSSQRWPRPAPNSYTHCFAKPANWALRTCTSKPVCDRRFACTAACRICPIRRFHWPLAKNPCSLSSTTSNAPCLTRRTTWISVTTREPRWDVTAPITSASIGG